MIRNVIFDWSGTLVDDLPAVWQATNYVFEKAGLQHLSLETFRQEFSLPFKDFYQRFTPHISMEQLEEWFHGRFRLVQDQVTALPHARVFLEACRRLGIRTFLLSTVHRDHYCTHSQTTGFGDFIDHPYVEILDKRLKILDILRDHHLEAAETLFIGDMQHDIETATHGGVHSCAVLTGYNSLQQLRLSHPDLIVEHLGELLDLLERRGWDIGSPSRTAAEAIPISTVGAAIFNDLEEVLMIRTQKWSNLWGIPGGKIKFGESSVAALRREIMEETNLEIGDIHFVLVQDCIQSQEFYRDAHFILLNYACRRIGTTPVILNEEAQEFKWTPLNEAFKLPLNDPTRKLLVAIREQPLPWTK
jgi:phosphoglycolate phosphatase